MRLKHHFLLKYLNQEGSFICVLGISNLHISTIFLLNAGTVPTVFYIFFHFIHCFTMGQTSFGRMESFIFLYIWNQKCSIQYPVLHNYYTAWFSLVRLNLPYTSLTPSLFIEVPEPGGIIYMCVGDIEFTYLLFFYWMLELFRQCSIYL
jgi:hypothetical protein